MAHLVDVLLRVQRITVEERALHRVRQHPADGRFPRSGDADDHGRSTKRSMASANPSSVFDVVTNVAACCTSALALPMAMLTPLRRNMRTSLGMSPMVAICEAGMVSSADRTPITSPLLALGWVTTR